MSGRHFRDERISESGQRVVDRIADVSMVDVDAIRRWHELDHLACMERSIHGIEGGGRRGPVVDDGGGHFAEGGADSADTGQIAARDHGMAGILGPKEVGALAMDDSPIDEP
jgi:hypothetical protein